MGEMRVAGREERGWDGDGASERVRLGGRDGQREEALSQVKRDARETSASRPEVLSVNILP